MCSRKNVCRIRMLTVEKETLKNGLMLKINKALLTTLLSQSTLALAPVHSSVLSLPPVLVGTERCKGSL